MAKISKLTLPVTNESTGQVTSQTFDIGGKEYTAGYGISINNSDEIASTTFVGTQAEWDALTPAEQAAFDIINITDDYTPSTEIQISYVDSLPVSGIKDVVYGLRSFGTPATATAADGFLDSVSAFTKTSLLPSGYEYTSGIAEISLDGTSYTEFEAIVYDGTKFVIDGETDLALGDTLYYRVLSSVSYYGGDAKAQSMIPFNDGVNDIFCVGTVSDSSITASVPNFELREGSLISIQLSGNIPNNCTLNINSTGAKSIYFKGHAIKKFDLPYASGKVLTLVYDGTYYHVVSLDGVATVKASDFVEDTSGTLELSWGEQGNVAQIKYNIANDNLVWNRYKDGSYKGDIGLVDTTWGMNLKRKYNEIDLKQSNNGITSNVIGTPFLVNDKNNLDLAALVSGALTDGRTILQLKLRNFDSSGTMISNRGISLYVNKSGELTYYFDNSRNANAALGCGYGTCTTAEATAAKEATLSSYEIVTGGYVIIKFTYAVPASATLNINSKGAKPIYYRGAAISDNKIKAGDRATFIYNGSQYDLIANDGWGSRNLDLIYGAEWDGSSSSAWTRTDDAIGFADPNPAVNNGDGSSPFDDIMPWAGMKRMEDPNAGTLVSIPKYYYKWTRDGAKMKLQISPTYVKGFLVSPAHADRGDGEGERDVVYVGAYHCDSSTYKSTTGVLPMGGKTRETFRTAIHNLGSNIWPYDYAMYWTIMMLYLVEYADWNSQAKIGYGCSDSGSLQNSGLCDSMTYHTGTNAANRTTYGHTRYRYIEDLWGNVFDWCDGIYFSSGNVYVIKNPADFSDTTGGTLVGTRVTSSGYISAWTNPSTSGFEYALYPSAVKGSASTYVCDYSYYNDSGVALRVGGNYSNNQNYGAFFWNSYHGASHSGDDIGSRLQKLP